jgi:hypothetical protein
MNPCVGSKRAKCKSPRYKHMTYDVMKAHSLASWRRNQCAITRELSGGGKGMYYVTCVSNTIMLPQTTRVIVAFFSAS